MGAGTCGCSEISTSNAHARQGGSPGTDFVTEYACRCKSRRSERSVGHRAALTGLLWRKCSPKGTGLGAGNPAPPLFATPTPAQGAPSGNPGKFSTSVVVVSCPPAAIPFAIHPSNSTGARAAHPGRWVGSSGAVRLSVCCVDTRTPGGQAGPAPARGISSSRLRGSRGGSRGSRRAAARRGKSPAREAYIAAVCAAGLSRTGSHHPKQES